MRSPALHRPRLWSLLLLAVLSSVAFVRIAGAEHESSNLLTFAAAGSSLPAAAGSGRIEYKGGELAVSRWTATFQFEGLQAGDAYSVVVAGRFGVDNSPAAAEFTELCAFRAGADGTGGCWHYFVELQRLAVVELRTPNPAGSPVLQATRADDAPGEIESVPNAYSPPPTPSPVATPASTPVT